MGRTSELSQPETKGAGELGIYAPTPILTGRGRPPTPKDVNYQHFQPTLQAVRVEATAGLRVRLGMQKQDVGDTQAGHGRPLCSAPFLPQQPSWASLRPSTPPS